ncbi:TIGR00341 family protein [Hyphomonas sp. WL0036]|uniref:TIGR00341 family protein n=1 Tax=Hyphomonas sediminis TaxID=2866160 RepID=UPI001C7FA2B6|nr:TIGR00341 family protein [Hyphomonas sediminis]MBY9068378.1 TIGR00341 family protein [Hyphomonas sediminis]
MGICRVDIHLADGEAFDIALRVVKAADPFDYLVLQPEQKDRRLIQVYMRDGPAQSLLDNLQSVLEDRKNWRITVASLDVTIPKLPEPKDEKKNARQQNTREELYVQVSSGAKLDRDFIVMVILSTIVAAIGLVSDGVAAVIGAMVIAPLLGPILGFAMGAALGELALLRRGILTLLAGIGIALAVSFALAMIMPPNWESRELMSRAEVRLDGLALAMAAGGAAALSVTRGASSALVGVMVAAALLPPGAAFGLFLGYGEWQLALRAALLLSLNVAALILSALIVFRLRKIRPRTWIEQQHADRAVWLNAALSGIFLLVSIALILLLDLGQTVDIGN